MIRRGRSTRYTATAGSTGSDIDALQTDVMRFMSILGLCLMAVFALVQSIPLQETSAIRPEPEVEKLHEDIAVQQERARLLQAELNHLSAQIQSAQTRKNTAQQALSLTQQQLTQLVDQTEQARSNRDRLTAQARSAQERNNNALQALSSTQQQLTKLVDETEQARSDRERLTAELQVLNRQLAQGQDALAEIQQAAQKNKAHSMRELQMRLNKEQKKLDDISQRASVLKKKPAPAKPVIKKPPPPAPKPVKQGFTLRFASAAALERLVVAGTVSLYAMAGKQAWRLSLSNGRPDFAPDAFPGWFHEMAPPTVPFEYVQTLDNSMDRRAQSSVVWGVQLPSATKQGIASLTRGLQGGDLVIAADGQVTLAPE